MIRPMNVIETRLDGVRILEPRVFADDRGFFMETFNRSRFSEHDLPLEWAQDNHSRSTRGVIRGLHYQLPSPQGKLVRAARGTVYDVAVDIRRGSPTFGEWVGVELSDENGRQLWIPPDFAHGFCVVSEIADVIYKCTTVWSGPDDRGIRWDDPTIGIDWPTTEPVLSEKDRRAPFLEDAELLPVYEEKR